QSDQAMHHYLSEPTVMQPRGIDEEGEFGLLAHHRLGLAPDARPDRIDLVERVDGFGLLLVHERLPGPGRGPVRNETIVAQLHRDARRGPQFARYIKDCRKAITGC